MLFINKKKNLYYLILILKYIIYDKGYINLNK